MPNNDILEVWSRWKQNPNEEDFQKLYNAHKNTIERGISMFAGSYGNPLPPAAIKGEAIVAFDNALKTYKPESGASLDTWITSQLRTLQRFTRDNKDIAHIPENRLIHIGALRNREQFLTDQLGRPPSVSELADDLKWPIKRVKMLKKEMKRDLVGNQSLDFMSNEKISDKMEELLQGLYYDLPPVQQKIMEYTFGWFGEKKMDIKGMSRSLGIPEAKLRYEKDKIAKRIEKEYGDIIKRI